MTPGPGRRPSLQEVIDRTAITSVLHAFSTAVDRRDFELLATCFWPGASDDHGPFKGSIEEFIPWLAIRAQSFIRTQHLLGQSRIAIADDRADVETHFLVYQLLPDAQGQTADEFMGGRYLDRMELRDDEWRISRRKLVFDWYRRAEDTFDWPTSPFRKHCHLGLGKPDDALYSFFADQTPA